MYTYVHGNPHCDPQEKERRKRAKAKLAQKSKLSFLGADEEGEEEDNGVEEPERENTANSSKSQTVKLGKDPTIPTHFLPDKEREEVC